MRRQQSLKDKILSERGLVLEKSAGKVRAYTLDSRKTMKMLILEDRLGKSIEELIWQRLPLRRLAKLLNIHFTTIHYWRRRLTNSRRP